MKREVLFIAAFAAIGCGGDDGGRNTSGATLPTGGDGATSLTAGDASTSDASASDGGPGGGPGTSGSGTGGEGGSAGDGADGGDDGPDPSIPTCWLTCAAAADCATAGGPAWDGDNYACDDSRCRYLGCHDDAECGTGFECADNGSGTRYCFTACATVDDCVIAGRPDFDGDNYSCDGRACIYTGCIDDAECQSAGSFVCRDTAAALFPGLEGVPTCVTACSTPTDCDLGTGGAYDADNYDCVDGGCVWIGCHDDAECGSGQVCR